MSAVTPGASPPPDAHKKTAASVTAGFDRVKKLVVLQTWAIAGLTLLLLAILPFAQPTYIYYAMKPEGQTKQMIGLDMPNMTNRSVLAWAATSITEVMTMGFGDVDIKLPRQRKRFTKKGWDAYNKAFVQLDVGETFKKNQLVLTTVPSNTPVILGQGTNLDQVYQWNVQMPVIMTYATNNNKTAEEHAFVNLEIVRIPAEEGSAGIAIQSWQLTH